MVWFCFLIFLNNEHFKSSEVSDISIKLKNKIKLLFLLITFQNLISVSVASEKDHFILRNQKRINLYLEIFNFIKIKNIWTAKN